ncbi:uncharacterized protein LOC110252588 [Paramuricea clavata]|uniref:Uncharacterized protein LOC110252588 n=1 Tax=Paramuricea clavata TaxID=317549 RepID=A0A7D9IIA2_PARCT|nr:uncharacterized protein LOC110252588 [Paramuricea clavata]
MKENEIIPENQRVKLEENKLKIDKIMESDAGYYTCSVTTPFGIQNKTAFLTVIQSEEEEDDESEEQDEGGDYSGEGEELYPCGRPRKKLTSACDRSYGFTGCKSFAPAVNSDDIEIMQKLDNITMSPPTLRMKVQWKVPKAGNSDIWGWQIIVADVGPFPGSHGCIQVNRKFIWESDNGELYVNYTFKEIQLGAKLKIQIQSLPAVARNKGVMKEISTKLGNEHIRREKEFG